MSEVYLYAADCDDFDTIGIVGALVPTSCTYTETANGNSVLSMTHPMDELGRYKQIKNGMILKASVPVRSVPEILNGDFIDVVTVYTVKNTATKANRYIYNRAKPDAKKDKKLKLVPVGGVVTVLATYTDDGRRWKCSYKYKSGKKWKTVTGYIAHDSNTLAFSETRSVPKTSTGQESVSPSWSTKEQLFRIYSVNKSMTAVSVEAQHISYDLMYNLTTYNENGAKTAQEALSGVLDSCLDEDHGFTVQTNINGSKAGYHYADKDPITALLDPDDGIITRFNGQLVRDNYSLSVLDQAGANRGMRIEYGKNLQSIGYSIDMSNMATAIRPIGQSESGSPIYLNKSYVVSSDGSTATEIAGDTRGIVYAYGYNSVPFQRIYALNGDDCTASKKEGITESIVRKRLLDQAIAAIAGGAAVPEVSVTVDMISIADSVEYADYSDLEKYFLFDTVRVHYPPMDIDIDTAICEIEYDLKGDYISSITLGSIRDRQQSISSWQIGSINGTKLIPGTIGASALADDAISARHIQADSINADAIQANQIATKHIAAEGIDAGTIKTGKLNAERIDAGAVAAEVVKAENFSAKTAEIVNAQIGTADISYAHIADLNAGTGSVDYLFTKDGNGEKYYFEKLGVTSAQILSLMVGLLVLRGNDGKYYEISVGTDADGNVTFAPKEYTGTITHDDSTGADLASGGRYVFGDTVDTETLFATNANIADAVITNINAKKLVASDAFISRLATRAIVGSDSIEDIAKPNTLIRLLDDGIHITDSKRPANVSEVVIDSEGMSVNRESKFSSRFSGKYAQFGNYQLRKSADGGLVFKLTD